MRYRSQVLAGILLAALVPLGPGAPVSAQPSAQAPAIPDTTAGRQFSAWLAAFNSDDPAEFDNVMRREFPTWTAPPGATRGLRSMSGGFDPVRVESAGDGQIVVLL